MSTSMPDKWCGKCGYANAWLGRPKYDDFMRKHIPQHHPFAHPKLKPLSNQGSHGLPCGTHSIHPLPICPVNGMHVCTTYKGGDHPQNTRDHQIKWHHPLTEHFTCPLHCHQTLYQTTTEAGLQWENKYHAWFNYTKFLLVLRATDNLPNFKLCDWLRAWP